jgi:hypothetical protein
MMKETLRQHVMAHSYNHNPSFQPQLNTPYIETTSLDPVPEQADVSGCAQGLLLHVMACLDSG